MSGTEKSEIQTAGEEVPCPSCFALNGIRAVFCAECGRPLGAQTGLDTVQSIRTQGWVYQTAIASKPPTLAGVVAIWAALAALVAGPTGLVVHNGGDLDSSFGVIVAVWALVGATAIGRTIAYARARRSRSSSSASGDQAAGE